MDKEDLLGRPIKDGEGLVSAHVLRWGGSDQADTLCGEEREKMWRAEARRAQSTQKPGEEPRGHSEHTGKLGRTLSKRVIRSLVCVEKIIGAGGKAHTGWASFPEPVEHPTSLGGESGTVSCRKFISFSVPAGSFCNPRLPQSLEFVALFWEGVAKVEAKIKNPKIQSRRR